ncbi:Crp/Fnr family transcriptional regulator [Ferruginibacter sp.]|nr:Crp/Fnr family transcriptional regulator [Ferruginibacter sp.]
MSLKKNKKIAENMNEVDDEIMNVLNSEEYLNFSTKEEAEFIAEFTEVKKVEKGTLLLKEGKLATTWYYVYKGCIREYCLKDGEEITTEFYTAGDSLSDDTSKFSKSPSLLNWECVVDSIVSVVPFEVQLEMFKRFPRLERLCRIETEKKLGDFKVAVNNYNSSSPVERYDNLLKTRPEIFELVPLYHIASYLGVKPESLSRIRNRIRNAYR